jgi:outer membrane biosynthesis protein TonB
MSQRNMSRNTAGVEKREQRIQFDAVSVDMDLLDEKTKSSLAFALHKRAKELSKRANQSLDVSKLRGIKVNDQIIILAKRVNDLEALLDIRKQQHIAQKKEEAITASLDSNVDDLLEGELPHLLSEEPHRFEEFPALNDESREARKSKSRLLDSAKQKPATKPNQVRKNPQQVQSEELTPKKPGTKTSALNKTAKHVASAKSLALNPFAKFAKKDASKTDEVSEAKTPVNRPAVQTKGPERHSFTKTASKVRKPLARPEPDEDSELEEGNFFNLEKHYLESLKRKPQLVTKDSVVDVEIAIFENKKLQDVHLVCAGGLYQLKQGWRKHSLVKLDKKGKQTIRMPKDSSKAILHRGSEAQPLEPNQTVRLKVGERIDLKHESQHYLIRAVIAPQQRPYVPEAQEKTEWKKFFGGSAVMHLLVLIVIGVSAVVHEANKPEPEPEFVQIDLSALIDEPVAEVEPPKPEPKPEPEPLPEPEPEPEPEPVVEPPKKVVEQVQPAPQPKPQQTVTQAKAAVQSEKSDGNVVNKDVKSVGLLGALGAAPAAAPASSNNAVAQVTNLDAVESPNSNSGLKVAGLATAVEGVRTTVPTGEIVNSVGDSKAFGEGGNQLASLARGNTASGDVRGALVEPVQVKKVEATSGISKAAVGKVIHEHLDEINFCYEKALAFDPNIAGQAAFEWTILPNGSVGSVGIASSSIQSDSVHTCIQAAIRTWNFPNPNKASVDVSYPFVFDMVGF